MNTVKKLLAKYRELLLYVLFGGLTTLINIAVYGTCTQLLHLSTGISNALAWVLSVLFAYLTNRKWVFESTAHTPQELLREATSFVSCRLGTGVLDQMIMVIGVDVFGARFIPAQYADLWSMGLKIASNILVILLNYIFSKLIIFRKKDK